MKNGSEAEIFGHVERITFHNDENGYTVAHLQQPRTTSLTCIVGTMPGLQVGESVRCSGLWKQHLIHGHQFEVKSFQTEAPADLVGIERYLGSGLIKGIGPAYAKRITGVFGIETLHVIDNQPDKLLDIPGIGKKRAEFIAKCWSDQKSIRNVMIFLQQYGISPAFAQKIFKKYGQDSIKKMEENPYILAQDLHGVGFKTADAIAQKMGIALDSPARIDAGILHCMSEITSDGNSCYPKKVFLSKAREILQVSADNIDSRVPLLEQAGSLISKKVWKGSEQDEYVWLKPLFLSEIGITREVRRHLKAPCSLREVDVLKAVSWSQGHLQLTLASEQQEALKMTLEQKISIITGGPGTGKSTITRAILAIHAKLTSRIILAAPTGKAAKRLSEITGRKGSTIHSTLSYDFKNGGFKHNRENPLECDLIIIDEASMIDTVLMYNLLKAIPLGCRIVLIGDVDQLPSVGPGTVLKDLIDSGSIPVTRLKEIFRQAANSQIIVNAHRINAGIFPQIDNNPQSDFFFIDAEEPEKGLHTLVGLVTQRLPKVYGFNPLQDIQILAPMRRGVLGIDNLNNALQKALNKRTDFLYRAGRQFLIGDKVMQIRNNYNKNVFNGDVGFVESIDLETQEMSVKFDEREVLYEFSELDELVLAYAVSVHKFQGSECPCVIMVLHTSHFMMLNKPVVYTGITRGKKMVVIVGMKKALVLAIKNVGEEARHTLLKEALLGAFDD